MTSAELAVLLYGRRIGTIERDDSWLTLRYEEDYSADPNATPLSLSMPPATSRHRTRATEAYLRGLLPDSADVIRRWATLAGTNENDTLGLVREIGRDCPGAAIFVTPGECSEALSAPSAIEPITDREIALRLRRLRTDDADWRPADEHWSLAGAQGKFTLTRTENGWGLAHGSQPSTHIIKPGIPWLASQALTEHISMETLRRLGIEVAKSEYLEFDGEPAIVIERFDRMATPGGNIARIHSEDMCQAFGIMPHKKYPADGGPGVQQIGELLNKRAQSGEVARFADAIVGNYLLGAPDAHAKNYAILLAGPQARLAPLYDVASGLGIVEGNGRLRFPKVAMSIGGENRIGAVAARHWDKFARQLDHRGASGIATMHAQVASLAAETQRLLESAPDDAEDSPGQPSWGFGESRSRR